MYKSKIPDKLYRTPGAVINFTVMDHDLMWTNDFEGEAFVSLSSVVEVDGELSDFAYRDLECIELALIQPKRMNKALLKLITPYKDCF
jgi:BAI1-associated protein 3